MKSKITVAIICVCLMLGITGCSKEENTITIASKPMTEQFIIAEMMKALIENDTDVSVIHKEGIGGGTSNIHPAMIKGEIDIYPEYTGTGWLFVLKENLMNDPDELYKSVKKKYKEEYNIIWSDLYGFNDTYGIAMKESVAKEHNIKTYSDLAKVSKKLRFGAEYDFFERQDGYPGLMDTYKFEFENKTELDIGLKYQAIGSGEIDVINVFSTDGRLEEYELVVLEDDLNFFASYYCASLIREETAKAYPEVVIALNKLSGEISNIEMTKLNYLVEIRKEDAKAVATKFLEDKGLLK